VASFFFALSSLKLATGRTCCSPCRATAGRRICICPPGDVLGECVRAAQGGGRSCACWAVRQLRQLGAVWAKAAAGRVSRWPPEPGGGRADVPSGARSVSGGGAKNTIQGRHLQTRARVDVAPPARHGLNLIFGTATPGGKRGDPGRRTRGACPFGGFGGRQTPSGATGLQGELDPWFFFFVFGPGGFWQRRHPGFVEGDRIRAPGKTTSKSIHAIVLGSPGARRLDPGVPLELYVWGFTTNYNPRRRRGRGIHVAGRALDGLTGSRQTSSTRGTGLSVCIATWGQTATRRISHNRVP